MMNKSRPAFRQSGRCGEPPGPAGNIMDGPLRSGPASADRGVWAEVGWHGRAGDPTYQGCTVEAGLAQRAGMGPQVMPEQLNDQAVGATEADEAFVDAEF